MDVGSKTKLTQKIQSKQAHLEALDHFLSRISILKGAYKVNKINLENMKTFLCNGQIELEKKKCKIAFNSFLKYTTYLPYES